MEQMDQSILVKMGLFLLGVELGGLLRKWITSVLPFGQRSTKKSCSNWVPDITLENGGVWVYSVDTTYPNEDLAYFIQEELKHYPVVVELYQPSTKGRLIPIKLKKFLD